MASVLSESRFQKQLIWSNALLPAFIIAWDAGHKQLGANPIEFVTRSTGVTGLVLLLITLMVTPAQKILGWNWAAKHRRALGLFSFFYAAIHFMTYVVFDRAGELATVPSDVLKRPFIALGMLCFFLMIPLAASSSAAAIRKMGSKTWKRLHQLTYLCAVLAVIHYALIVKSDLRYPLAFAFLTAALLFYRIRRAALELARRS